MGMVHVSIEHSRAIFAVQGWHRLLAFKTRLEIRLAHIVDVQHAPANVLSGWWKGIRLPGVHVPGLLAAGTFFVDGERAFWDVRDPSRAIVVELTDEPYKRLIIEVADPAAEVARFRAAPLT